MESTKHRTFRRRADGVLGVGFVMMFGGVQMASIAWPDAEAQRYIVDDMARNGVDEFIPIEQMANWKPPTVAEVLQAHGIASASLAELIKANSDNDPKGEIVPDGEGGAIVIGPNDSAVDNPHPAILSPAIMPDVITGFEGNKTAPPAITEAQAIRNYLAEHGSGATNKDVIAALALVGIKVTSSQVSTAKKEMASAENAVT